MHCLAIIVMLLTGRVPLDRYDTVRYRTVKIVHQKLAETCQLSLGYRNLKINEKTDMIQYDTIKIPCQKLAESCRFI